MLDDALTRTLRYAPELQNAPGLAVAAAQTEDPTTGQAVAHTANQANLADGYDTASKHHGSGFLGSAFHWLGGAVHHVIQDAGTVVADGLHVASLPLQEVQHQYRYLHDVESRHGPLAALLEGLGMAVAGVGATIATGGNVGAGVLAAEAAGGAIGRLSFNDSWNRTINGEKYRDPTTNRPVSIGRDLASTLGLKPSSKPYSIVSGLSDMVSDLAGDPLAQGLGLLHAPASEEGLQLLGRKVGGTLIDIAHPADIDRVVDQVPAVKRAMLDLAKMDEGQIANRYKSLSPLAGDLANAKTLDEVKGVFKDQAKLLEMWDNVLPTRTYTKTMSNALASRLGEYMGPGSKALRTTPYVLDEALRKGAEMDVDSPEGYKAVYDTFRFAFGRKQSEAMLGQYVAARGAERIKVYRNGVVNVLTELGLDPDLVRGLKGGLEEVTDGIGGGTNEWYASDIHGRNISQMLTDDGHTHAAAIFRGQTGKITLPNWDAVVNELRGVPTRGTEEFAALSKTDKLKATYGGFDEWMYHNFTQRVFKPLALATLGFAQRMSLSEAIPEILRHGPGEYAKNLYTSTATKLALDADPAEMPHRYAALVRMLGGEDKFNAALEAARNGGVSETRRLQRAMELSLATDNHMVTPATSSTHGFSAELMDDQQKAEHTILHATRAVPQKYRATGEYFGLPGGDPRAPDAWAAHLKFATSDPAAQAAAKAMLTGADPVAAAKEVLDNTDPATLDRYLRHIGPSDPAMADNHGDWARVIVEGLKGATHTPILDASGAVTDATPIKGLLESVAAGRRIPPKDLAKIPAELRPLNIPSRELDPIIGSNRVTDKVFHKLSGFINTMARQPQMLGEYTRQFDALEPAIEEGLLSHWEVIDKAKTNATHAILPFIHNPSERALASTALRNYMPFYYAQQQAYTRFGRLLIEDPAAFRREQLLISGLANIGHVTEDGQGNQFLNYPGVGFLTGNTVGALKSIGVPLIGSLPIAMTGDLKSLNTVLPFAEGVHPGIGPVAAIPLKAVLDLFPEATPLASDILGTQSTSAPIWNSLLPNSFMQRTVAAFGSEHKRAFASSMMQTVQYLAYKQEQAMTAWVKAGHSEDDPDAPRIIPGPNDGVIKQQEFIDRVKNQTRINFLMRAIVGLVTPASPQLQIGDVQLPDELRKLIHSDGLSSGTQKFLTAHPDATPYTVYQSKNLTGAPLSASREAQDFYDTHQDFLRKYPNGGAWLLPQSGKFDQAIYNEQLAQHLRIKKAPTEFLNDIYTAAGNHQFFEVDKPKYDQLLSDAKARGDKDAEQSIRRNFNAYLQQRGLMNPVWWNDFQSNDRAEAKKLAINDLTKMVADSALPKGGMASGVRSLLDDYNTFQSLLIVGRQDTDASASNKAMNANWQAYLGKLATEQPELKPLIRKVFLDYAHADPTQKTALQQIFAG